jgi:hypothetical protein
MDASRLVRLASVISAVGLLAGSLACSDLSSLAGKQAFPAGTPDPNSFNTAAGAMALYQTELAAFQYAGGDTSAGIGGSHSIMHVGAFVDYIVNSGMLADELQSGLLSSTPPAVPRQFQDYVWTDSRRLQTDVLIGFDGVIRPPSTNTVYTELQGIRGGANLAIGALTAYSPNTSTALVGHMYALKGYAEVMLAELFCSGVPLSTIDFQGDFTYHAGSTTEQLYRDAIAQFDQAINLSADSSRVLNLARVGKGRALLGLGLQDSAAIAVQDVTDGFSYQFFVDWNGGVAGGLFSTITVANVEGGNGLPYINDGTTDARTTSGTFAKNAYGTVLYAPRKYSQPRTGTFQLASAIAPVTVADWIEARLIRAEAALAAGDVSGWIGQLNFLREHAITPALADLNDPGSQEARLALMFKERAYWLFLSGHRQGDMRRLIRQYHLDADAVYPTGAYPPGEGIDVYGEDVTAPVPSAERINNPLFAGCFSRGA